jgi:hypothetical protein
MNTPLARKVVAGAAAACALLLIAALLAPKASSPIANGSPSPSSEVSPSPLPEASVSTSPSPTASPLEKFRLTVVMTGAESGSVISVPAGIDCPKKCSALVLKGTKVVLQQRTGEPPIGYDMIWLDWAERCPGAGTSCEVIMTRDKTLHAALHLRPARFGLNVSVVGSGGVVTSAPGGIDCGATCSGMFNAGVVILTAGAAVNYRFDGWSGACTGTGPCAITLGAYVDVPPVEVTANFSPIALP